MSCESGYIRSVNTIRILHDSIEMESLNPILSNLSYEMTCYGLVEELLHMYSVREALDNAILASLLNCDTLDFEEDLFETILLSKICELDEEYEVMKRVIATVNYLLSTPDAILRPYQQHFVTLHCSQNDWFNVEEQTLLLLDISLDF